MDMDSSRQDFLLLYLVKIKCLCDALSISIQSIRYSAILNHALHQTIFFLISAKYYTVIDF